MTVLNPSGSAARMLAIRTNTRGFCLVAVGAAVLDGKPVLDHATDAEAAYIDAGKAHQHTTHAPADFPMFFSGAGGKGDVVISVGDGVNCIASDYTLNGKIQWGHIGRMTLAARARQVGGNLLGWTDHFLGYDLAGAATSSTGSITPVATPNGVKMRILGPISPADKSYHHLLEIEGAGWWKISDTLAADGDSPAADACFRVINSGAPTAADLTVVFGIVAAKPAFPVYAAPVTGGSSTTSLQPALDAIANLAKLEATDQAALVTALSGLPAAVRAKIVAAP